MKSRMLSLSFNWLLAVFFVQSTSMYAQITEAEKLYEQGIYQLEGVGDFEEAINYFNKVVTEYPADKEIAAKALLKKGFCYERLGSQKATEAYKQIIDQYPDQVNLVTQARERLTELKKSESAGLSMTRLLPPDVYLECQTLSPDGTKIAGISWNPGQNIAVYDLLTKELKFITDYENSDKSCVTYAPVWSPDGQEIVYWVSCWGDPEFENPMLRITSLNGESRILFQNENGVGVAACSWLPDKSAILAAVSDKDRVSKLVLISLEDGSSRDICALQSQYGPKDVMMSQASGAADVSPDGRYIAYSDARESGNNDIYVVSTEGGESHILLDHPASEIEPHWSPDGEYLAFRSNRHGSWALWGVKVKDGQLDSDPFMILEGMQDTELASWTQNGLSTRTMASNSDIYLLDIDPQTNDRTGKPRLLDTKTYGTSNFPLWSPDGEYMSYKTYSRSENALYIMIMPLKGGETAKYIPDYPINPIGGSFQWFPDGSGIGVIYWDKDIKLYMSKLNPVSGKWTTEKIPTGDFKGHLLQVTWSEDGKSFYYTYIDGEDLEIKTMNHDLETGSEKLLNHYSRTRDEDWNWWNLRNSRDNKHLAFHMNDKLCIMDIETGDLHLIEYDPEKSFYAPTWSPDGKNLLVKGPHEKGDELNELYIVSTEDGSYKCLNISQYLPKGARIMTVQDWSPDGKTIAFDTRTWKSEANLVQNVIPKEILKPKNE